MQPVAWWLLLVAVAAVAGTAGFLASLQVGRQIARSVQQPVGADGTSPVEQLSLAEKASPSKSQASGTVGSIGPAAAAGLASGRTVLSGSSSTTTIRSPVTTATATDRTGEGQSPEARTGGVLRLDELFGPRPDRAPASVEQLVAEAKQVGERLVRAFPNRADAHEVVARLYFMLGETEQATAAWKKCLELDPKYAYAYHGLGSAAAKRGELEEAARWYRRALEANPSLPDTQIELARTLIDLNKLQEAIELLEKNVAIDPRPYRGRVLLGMAYMQLQDYQKAKENYEAAIAAHPKHANAHFGLATACARLGEEELSREYMEKFQKLRAEEREIGAQERLDFNDLDAVSAEVARIYTDAARICRVADDLSDMELLCRRAAAMDERNIDCRQALAWLHLQRGQVDRTIELLEQLASLDPGNIGYPAEIARLYAATGRAEKGEQRLRQVCEAQPKSAPAFAALAQFLLQQPAKIDQAIRAAQTAVEIAPLAAHYALLGAAQQKKGNLDEARKALSEAVRLAPENLRYKQLYEQLKNHAESGN